MAEETHKPIALTMGDPAGCGPQITGLAWEALRERAGLCFVALGPARVFAPYAPVHQIKRFADAKDVFETALPVLDSGITLASCIAGEPDAGNADATISSIEHASHLVLSGEAAALVTNPINKALLYGAGFAHPGHTEFLANLCAGDGPAPLPVMMLVGGGLRVALATIHEPLMRVGELLTTDLLNAVGNTVHNALVRDFGVPHPRLAFTGLNPHAGENGSIGTEERDFINPAAEFLRASGVDIVDARPADTVFAEMLGGDYDAIIAMTHDQGLIPVKTLDFWGGVNVTLGLPIIRTSPDHGTAYEAAARGACRADSLIAAIKLATSNARMRAV